MGPLPDVKLFFSIVPLGIIFISLILALYHLEIKTMICVSGSSLVLQGENS